MTIEKITPCLWFDGNAEEAANFYVTLLPDSRIRNVQRSPADNPSTPALAKALDDIARTIRERVDAMPDHEAAIRAHGAWGAA